MGLGVFYVPTLNPTANCAMKNKQKYPRSSEPRLAEEQITLLQTITMDVTAAQDLPSALGVVLRRVCEKTGWAFGQAWVPRPDGKGLDCCPAWFTTASSLEEFRASSRNIILSAGVGLPGRVWASRQPAWIRDVTLDTNFPRAEAARKSGLRAALGVPILSGDEVIAVLEFFLSAPREEDERLVTLTAAVAAQIGLVIERKRAQEENRKLIHYLGERVKELTALHRTARILQNEANSVSQLLQEIVALLPPAWQYPEVTAGRISFGALECQSPNFVPTQWSQMAEFTAGGVPGALEVVYLEERPAADVGPFLSEESNLINSLAEMISSALNNKSAQKALRGSEEVFRTLAETISAGIYIHRNMRFVYVNPAAERLTGYNRDELLTMNLLDVIHPSFRELVKVRVAARGRGETLPQTFEDKILTKGGETRWVEVTAGGTTFRGEPATLVTTFDITERKRAEEALRESERRFSDTLTNINMIAVMADMNGNITFCNDYLLRLTDWKREEAIGRNWYEMFLPDDQKEKVSEILDEVEPTGEVTIHLENEIKARSGERRLVKWTNTTLRGLDGEVIGIAALGDDITERKEAEEQLKASSDQLRALSERLRKAKEDEGIRIARELHDELGSALTSLKWSLLGLKKVKRGPGNSSAVEKITEMVELVDATINAVRRISSELRPGVLDNLGLVSAIEWQAQQFQGHTGIVCECDSLVDDVDLTREQATVVFRILQEAMTNILRHAQATKVNVILEEEDGELVLEVRDNGRGITESEKLGARSLGLLGMRERANSIGGRIDITGTMGRGTKLIVRLPTKSEAVV